MAKNYKLIVWHVIVVGLALWMWGYGHSVSFNVVTGLDFNLPAGIAFVLLTTVIALGYALFLSQKWAISVSAIVGVIFMAFFGFTWLNFLAMIGFYLFNLYAVNKVQSEMLGRVKLNIRMALTHGLYPVIIGLFLMMSFAAYQSQLAKDIEKSKQFPSQIQTFFQQISGKMYSTKIEGTPKQKQAIFQQIAAETYLGINSLFQPYFRYAPPLLSFALFLILLGLSWVFAWVGIGVGLLLFWILKKTKLLKIEERDAKAEVLVV